MEKLLYLFHRLLNMQEHVIELFKMSFLPDSEKLKYVTSQMEELSKQQGIVPLISRILPHDDAYRRHS